MKFILADSDIEHINKIKGYISNNFNQLKIEKPIFLFKDFIRIIDISKPDIVLVEFSFLGNSIFQTIKDLVEKYPQLQIILYGISTEVENMKKCVEMGASGYIFRPVKPSDLNTALENAISYFDKENLEFKKEENIVCDYKSNIDIFELNFLFLLVEGKLTSHREILSGLSYFGIKLISNYRVAIVTIDHFRDVIIDFSEKEKHLLAYKVYKSASSLIPNCKAFMHSFNQVVIIMGESYDLDLAMSLLQELKLAIKTEHSIEVSIGIGRDYEQPIKISVSFNEAKESIRHRCVIGYNNVIAIEQVDPYNEVSYVYPLEIEKNLIYTAVIGEYNYSIYLLNIIFKDLKKVEHLSLGVVSQILVGIIISINRKALEKGIYKIQITDYFDIEKLINIDGIDLAYIVMETGLKKYCYNINKIRNEIEAEFFEKSVEYINSKFYDEITYSICAKNINCPLEYFKRIFNKKAQMSLEDYLSKVRVENACIFMKDGNLDDKILALNTGFEQDVSAFKTAFRKFIGKNTFEYRASIRKRH